VTTRPGGRSRGDAELLVAANLFGDGIGISLPPDTGWAAAAVVLTDLPGRPLRPLPDLELRPWESVVWRRTW
jgi:hypothetical protein